MRKKAVQLNFRVPKEIKAMMKRISRKTTMTGKLVQMIMREVDS